MHRALTLAALCLFAASRAHAQPTAHHPGAWSDSSSWPGYPRVQAIHMMLLRGDTLFARPHTQILAWGSWSTLAEEGLPDAGGRWGWNPDADGCGASPANLKPLPIATPALNPFCSGMATTASGDGIIVGGHERTIAGEQRSLRFNRESGQWQDLAPMTGRRWYGNAVMLSSPAALRGQLLATGGIQADADVYFGGRRGNGTLSSDVERYLLTDGGEFQPTLSGSGSGWPEPREYASMAWQERGPYNVFGGRDAAGLRNDVWQLRRADNDAHETYRWEPIAPVGFPPDPRWQHAAVIDRPAVSSDTTVYQHASMYVFGGEDASGQPRNDLWKLWWDADPQQLRWKWSALSATGPAPAPRSGHTAAWDESGNRMIVFGGRLADGTLSDSVFILANPGASPSWTVATPHPGNTRWPAGRSLHAMAWDFETRATPDTSIHGSWPHLAIFGGDTTGSGGASVRANDLWELWVEPAPGTRVIWRKLTPGGAVPAPRRGAAATIYERYPLAITICGGELSGGSADDESWEMILDAGALLQWEKKADLPQPLHGHVAVREQRQLTMLRPERYDPSSNTWTAFGNPKYQASYHMMFAGSDGQLYFPGPTDIDYDGLRSFRLDPATGAWEAYPSASFTNRSGTGVLYRPDRIMKCGHHLNANSGSPGTATLRLGLTPAAAQWLAGANEMALPRRQHTVTLLPTGEAIATGGDELTLKENNPWLGNPRLRPEIWDPGYVDAQGREGWWYGGDGPDSLASGPAPRGHHSSAVILPDARVLSGGGHDTYPLGLIRTVEQYCPPYLYRADGSAAFRPRLYGAQDHIAWGGTFEVACPDSVHAACLIRPGAATHTFNQDQRYVPLGIASRDSHRVVLEAPASAAVAPPGNYLLFVLRTDEVSGKLVPSIARWVNVGEAQTSYATYDTLPPAVVNTLSVTAVTSTTHTLSWNAPADAGEGSPGRAKLYELRYRAGQTINNLDEFLIYGRRVPGLPAPASPTTLQSHVVTGLSPDTIYHFRLMSRDSAGSDRNWSALSNVATSPPPGGCPFVDTRTAAGWQEENSILGRSLTGALALDGYRLRHAPAPEQGRIRLRMRENEQELTTLDQLRLIAIDHAPGVRAYALGDEVVLGTRVAAARVTTQAGLDVTALLDGTNEGFFGRPGDTLYVDLGLQAAPAGALGVSSVNSEHTVIIDDGGGKGGGNPFTWREPELLSASAVDAQVLGSTGIRLETQDETGAWQLLAHRYPREHPDEAAYEPPGHAPLRLVFVGEHRLRFVGRLERSGEPFTAHKLPLLEAMHTRLGDVATAIDTTGNLTTELVAGDTLALEFGWDEVPAGQEREMLLLSRGVYTANLPARGEGATDPPPVFAFHGARPNPFTGATALRFALPEPAHVRLEVLDAQGRRVAMLANEQLAAGEHMIAWDGRTTTGARVRPGVYFCRFEAGAHRARGKLVLAP